MAHVKSVRPRVGYSDLARAPEDGRRYELYDGEAFVVPAPTPRHQRAAQEIEDLFRTYARRHGGAVFISPIDIVFTEYDVLQPDIVFFEAGRAARIDPDQPIRFEPDITVEVLSPSTAATDRGKKMQAFARFGVREYWIVDPGASTVEVYHLEDDGTYALAQIASGSDTIRSTVLPDFEASAAIILAW